MNTNIKYYFFLNYCVEYCSAYLKSMYLPEKISWLYEILPVTDLVRNVSRYKNFEKKIVYVRLAPFIFHPLFPRLGTPKPTPRPLPNSREAPINKHYRISVDFVSNLLPGPSVAGSEVCCKTRPYFV